VTRIQTIGLFGTNPHSWRFKELAAQLRRKGLPCRILCPWLFEMEAAQEGLRYRYNKDLLSGPDGTTPLETIYVVCIGFDQLHEVLYKLTLLRSLASEGIRVVNSPEALSTCRNKVSSTLELMHSGLSVPTTMITESVHLAVDFIDAHKPCVLKPITGTLGKGLILIPAEMRREEIIDYVAWFQATRGQDVLYVQEFIEHPHYDIRALVIDHRVVSKMRRYNPDSWKTNIAAGAKPLPSDDDIDEIALKAAEVVEGEVVGVDILPSNDGRHYVLEVNGCPGWKGLQEVTDVNIADKVIQYLQSLV
jgi:RimK family alpha-L-glutamate ligase